ESASEDVVVSEIDVVARLMQRGKLAGNVVPQVLAYLRERDLLPLRYCSPALPYLSRLLGFVFGDGTVYYQKSGKGVVMFFGDAQDLESIRADVQALGVTPSRVYQRTRQHAMRTSYADYSFTRQECWFKVVGTGFAALMECLGAPVGKKARQDYLAPAWLDRAPLWQKRLFLSAFFGAKLTTPATIPNHDSVSGAPTVGMNKSEDCAESGRQFLGQLSEWLGEFGVATQSILCEPMQVNDDGVRSVRW